MQDKQKIDLGATEIDGLWNTYVTDSLAVCTLKYFLNTLHDEEIRHILQRALNISENHIQVITAKFSQDRLPVPKGFTAILPVPTSAISFQHAYRKISNCLIWW